MKKITIRFIRIFEMLFFDPVSMVNKWRGLPYFIRSVIAYKKLNEGNRFGISWKDLFPVLHDRFVSAGSAQGHYFYQDIWAAKELYSQQVAHHTDVGSRLDGFVGHILSFCNVEYIDIRPLDADIDGLKYRYGSVTDLPHPDNSVVSLSCLHVIEHIGLGRYGDPIDPDGYIKAADELSRVLAPGGRLLLSAPVGHERLCFDAHRVFDPATIVDIFHTLSLVQFSLIDDAGMGIKRDASFEEARLCDYGCGLFLFEKKC